MKQSYAVLCILFTMHILDNSPSYGISALYFVNMVKPKCVKYPWHFTSQSDLNDLSSKTSTVAHMVEEVVKQRVSGSTPDCMSKDMDNILNSK